MHYRTRLRATALCVAGLVFLGYDGFALAEAAPCLPKIVHERDIEDDPPALPTEVTVSFDVLQITAIDDADEQFHFDGYVRKAWIDPRLRYDSSVLDRPHCDVPNPAEVCGAEGGIWCPELQFMNDVSDIQPDRDALRVFPNGRVEYRARYTGDFSTDLDLRRFPFDSQKLLIIGETFDQPRSVVRFVPGITEVNAHELPEWDISPTGRIVEETAQYKTEPDPTFSRIVLEVSTARRPGFYFWKFMVPIVLIVMLSWAVFWLGSEELDGQLAISLTCLLSLIAFNYILTGSLPKVPYQTTMDNVILTAYVFVFLSSGQNVLCKHLTNRNKEALAARVDLWSRFAFPLAYLLVTAKIFMN
jgi:hypothetical protein